MEHNVLRPAVVEQFDVKIMTDKEKRKHALKFLQSKGDYQSQSQEIPLYLVADYLVEYAEQSRQAAVSGSVCPVCNEGQIIKKLRYNECDKCGTMS